MDFLDKVEHYGAAHKAMGSALKKTQYMRHNGLKLYRILEETNKHAGKLKNLNIPDEKGLEDLKKQQEELQNVAKQILELVPRLETCICKLISDEDSFQLLLKKENREKKAPSEFLPEFCSALEKLHLRVAAFSAEYFIFASHLKNIEQLALKMATSIAQKKEELKKIARRLGNGIAAAGAVAAVLGIAGIIALGFFTGGAAIAIGIIGGACYISGALTMGVGATKLKQLPKLASDIEDIGKSLEVIAEELKSIGDDATKFTMDKKAVEALEEALMLFIKEREEEEKRKEEKERYALMEEELAMERAEKMEIEEELARERAEKMEREKELERERAELERERAELARERAELAKARSSEKLGGKGESKN